MNTADLIQILTPVVVPMIIAAEAKWSAKIKPNYKPIVAIAIGQLSEALNAYFTGHTFSPATGAALGAAGVGLREVFDQTKQLLITPAPKAVDVTSVPPKV